MSERQPWFIAAIDQGTSSTRVVVYDQHGKNVAFHQVPLPLITPKPGWVEQDPIQIIDTCRTCLDEVSEKIKSSGLAAEGLSSSNVRAVGITNQRETTVVWDKETGKPLHNTLVWLDTRTRVLVNEYVHKFSADDGPGASKFRDATGLPISTYFSAMKIRWLIDNVPAVKDAVERNTAAFGTVDSWIMWNLTGGKHGGIHVTDVTNASRTNLMNLRSLSWDPAICKELDIPQNVLPTIKSSSEIYGDIKEGSFKGVPLAGCLGDQQAALVGQKCFTPGSVKNTYGTGCFMLYNIGTGPDAILPSKHGLLTTVGYKLGPNADAAYAFEGSVAIAGAGIEWLRSNLEVINDPKEIDKLAGSVPSTGGLFVVPAFSGLFAPYWRPDARGIAIGLTSFTTKAHFARAMLEATAFQTTEILDAMQSDSTVGIKELKVDGGLSKSSLLMQIQSDLLGLPVERPADIETTARGAAYAAGLAVGVYSPPEAASSEDSTVPTPDDDSVRFKPSISEASRAKRMQLWKKAVSRCLDWVNPDHDDTVDHDDDDKEFSS